MNGPAAEVSTIEQEAGIQTQDLSQTLATEEEGPAASSPVPRPFLLWIAWERGY